MKEKETIEDPKAEPRTSPAALELIAALQAASPSTNGRSTRKSRGLLPPSALAERWLKGRAHGLLTWRI